MNRLTPRNAWVLAAVLLASAMPVHAEEGATLAAMQIAYSMELNAQAKYLAFAHHAENAGQAPIACLFRVVARAESVHATRHARAIEQLQAVPVFHRDAFAVGTSAQNLRRSIETELRERSIIYPRFADHARAEHLYEPLATLNYARCAEATHEKMFRVALGRLEREPRGPEGIVPAAYVPPAPPEEDPEYYVCLGDGCVYSHAVARCPQCGSGARLIVRSHCHP